MRADVDGGPGGGGRRQLGVAAGVVKTQSAAPQLEGGKERRKYKEAKSYAGLSPAATRPPHNVCRGDSEVDGDGGERDQSPGELGLVDPAAEGLEGGRAAFKLLPQRQQQEQRVNAATDQELGHHGADPGGAIKDRRSTDVVSRKCRRVRRRTRGQGPTPGRPSVARTG